jgi:hypothetical protein
MIWPRWWTVLRLVSGGVIVVRREHPAIVIEYRIFMYENAVACAGALVFWNTMTILHSRLTFGMELGMFLLCLLVLAMGYLPAVIFFPGSLRRAAPRVLQQARVGK